MAVKRLRLVLQLGVSCLFAGYLIFKVDWFRILSALEKVDLRLYLISTLLVIISSFFLACKYYLLIKGSSLERSIPFLVKINLISRFYALFLPSVVGPDAVRWYKVTRNGNGRIFFLASTVFERLTFLLLALLCGLLPLFFCSSNPEIVLLRERILPIILAALFFVCAFIACFVYPALGSFLRSAVTHILPSHGKWKDAVLFLEGFSIKKGNIGSLVSYVFLFGFLWQVFFLFRMFILFKATALPFGFIDVAWMGSLVLLLQVLPVSCAGIGVREGAYAYLFTMFGLAYEKGVLIGILFFSQMLIFSGIGGLLEVRDWMIRRLDDSLIR